MKRTSRTTSAKLSVLGTAIALFLLVGCPPSAVFFDEPVLAVFLGPVEMENGDTYDFETVATGQREEVAFTIENVGAGELQLSETDPVSISGSSAFSLQFEAPGALTHGESTTFSVVFAPTDPVSASAVITVRCDAPPGALLPISLSGTGQGDSTSTAPGIQVTADSAALSNGGTYDFGSVSTSSPKGIDFAIRNSGTADLNLTGDPTVTVGGTDSSSFTITGAPTAIIAPGSTSYITITFAPASAGAKNATVSIPNDSEIDPFGFSLIGQGATLGTVAAPTFSPSGGTAGGPQTVTVSTATAGGQIKYTLDGSIPTNTNGTDYGAPIVVTTTATLQAFAYKTGWADSAVSSATYTITGDTTAPGDVGGFRTYPKDGAVTLTWNDPADIDLHHIEITWTPGGSTAQTVTSRIGTYEAQGLTSGTEYTFTAKAFDTVGNGSGGVTAISVPLHPYVALAGTVTHVAGPEDGGPGSADGIGNQARFSGPTGITYLDGFLYVGSVNTIRRIDVGTAEVTTFAGSADTGGSTDGTGTAASFTHVKGIVSDGTYLYVCDPGNHNIRRIDPATADVITFAGTTWVMGNVDGTGLNAQFGETEYITQLGLYLYVTDSEYHTIRQIRISDAEVTTLAGSPGIAGSADGIGSAARFNSPEGIVAYGGFLYVTDFGNSTIRKIDPTDGSVTTFAGSAGVSDVIDDSGTDARMAYTRGIGSHGTYLYFPDGGGKILRRIDTASAAVTTIAGYQHGAEGADDGIGSAARFSELVDVCSDGTYLYGVEMTNHIVRRIDPATNAVTTLAGKAAGAGTDNGIGAAAQFFIPEAIVYAEGFLFVGDSGNRTIRRIDPSTRETITWSGTFLAGATDGAAGVAQYQWPSYMTFGAGALYTADLEAHTIRKTDVATGYTSTVAGLAYSQGSVDGTGSVARFNEPAGIVYLAPYLYISERVNNTIRRLDPVTAEVVTIAGSPGAAGSTDGIGGVARFNEPRGMATDGVYLYVVERGNYLVRRIDPVSREITTVAGSAGVQDQIDGLAAGARFRELWGIASDGYMLYVTDNNAVRRINLTTGVVATIAGSPMATNVDGTGPNAGLFVPRQLVYVYPYLYVADTSNNCIRRIE